MTAEETSEHAPAARRSTVVQRLIRDTAMDRSVKVLYDYRCQVCGTRLDTVEGPYAEAAHIRPLGLVRLTGDTIANHR